MRSDEEEMTTKMPHEEKQMHEFVRKTSIVYGKI
jgi:hypothetical protein